MAIDLEAIRNRLTKLQSTSKRADNLWKPSPGKQIIRIVPYQHDKDNPFRELYFHYDLGKKTYLSPVTHGEADPCVEFAEKLKATGDRDDWKLSRQLEPKMRTYVPVLVRGKEAEGVKFWGFGKQIYQELLSIIADPDYGDITDLSGGRDIQVEFTAGSEGVFPKTTIRVKPAQTPATEDKNVAQKVLNGQKNIDDIFSKVTYEDLKGALNSWLNPDAEESESTTTSETTIANNAPAAGVSTSAEIDTAFDDLFSGQ
jgi:hypothetical protein